MECVFADEAIDMGENVVMDSWSWEVLTSLYGDIDPAVYDSDNQLDYAAVTQESLATPPQN